MVRPGLVEKYETLVNRKSGKERRRSKYQMIRKGIM